MTTLSHGTSLTGSGGVNGEVMSIDRVIPALYDSVRSYQTASSEAESPALAALMEELGSSRKNAYDAVVLAASAGGQTIPDEDPGTIGGAVQRGWMQIKGTLVGDTAVIDAALNGEAQLRAELRRAIDGIDMASQLEEALRRALLDVQAAEDRLQSLETG